MRVFVQCLGNHLEHGGQFSQHFVVPKPQHTPTLRLQVLGAHGIAGHALFLRMLTTIELDHHVARNACEISDIRTYRVLAPEFAAQHLVGP